jgi:histidine ammonia-lyase
MSTLAPVRLDGQGLTPAGLAAIAAGAPAVACPVALAALDAGLAAAPPGPSVLEAKRRLLVGPHADGLPADDLPRAFLLGHCAGVGEPLPAGVVRAAVAARANVLLGGVSGVRGVAVQALLAVLDGPLPVVPSQGSVGAAGDLAPMSHIAVAACGFDGGPRRFAPTPKEALAFINGVSVSAALAAVAVTRARRVLDAAALAFACTMEATGADLGLLDPRAHAARGHTGGQAAAAAVRALLTGSQRVTPGRAPDAFSIRCAPAVLGAATSALAQVEATVTAEIRGVSDNPLLFAADGAGPGAGEWVEAGNVHGAEVALAMDVLRVALVPVGSAAERRAFRLTSGDLTPGLPTMLVPGTGLNSGFMLAQYTAASLTSEMKGLAHPASVDSIPTVQHHEDHNSMAPIAARLALRSVDCLADVVAIELLLAAQALDLRARQDGLPLPPALAAAHARLRTEIPFWADDGVLHPLLVAAGAFVRSGVLTDPAPIPW